MEDRRDVAQILGLVARADMVCRRAAPVVGFLGEPVELAVNQDLLQRLVGIGANIGCKPEVCAWLHDAGEAVEEVWLDDAPLMVLLLRPWVGEKDKDTVEAAIRQPIDELAGILGPEADI